MLNPQNLASGHEQHEMFHAPGRMGKPGPERCQYDYRHFDKELFSCVAASLKVARERRREWLKTRFTVMTNDEYIQAREGGLYICPVCRSVRVEELEPLEWESPSMCEETATASVTCNDCGTSWREFLRPAGFNLE